MTKSLYYSLICIVIFFLLITLTLLTSFIIIFCNNFPNNHNYYSALGELLLVVILGIGEIIAVIHLWHSIKVSDFEIWNKLSEIWTKEEFTESRRRIFELIKTKNVKDWNKEEKESATEVCRNMTIFSELVPYFHENQVLEIWQDPICKLWQILEVVVREERVNTGWALKWKEFERLGKKAIDKQS